MIKKTVADSSIQYRQLVMPGHTNALGTLFGGTMLGWVDEACAMAAQKHSHALVVTVNMDNVSFREPVHLGDQVVVHAHVSYAGRTSMEVKAWVYRENPPRGICQLCLTALLSFVAIDDRGNPLEVPPLYAGNEQEALSIEVAKKRMEKRRRDAKLH